MTEINFKEIKEEHTEMLAKVDCYIEACDEKKRNIDNVGEEASKIWHEAVKDSPINLEFPYRSGLRDAAIRKHQDDEKPFKEGLDRLILMTYAKLGYVFEELQEFIEIDPCLTVEDFIEMFGEDPDYVKAFNIGTKIKNGFDKPTVIDERKDVKEYQDAGIFLPNQKKYGEVMKKYEMDLENGLTLKIDQKTNYKKEETKVWDPKIVLQQGIKGYVKEQVITLECGIGNLTNFERGYVVNTHIELHNKFKNMWVGIRNLVEAQPYILDLYFAERFTKHYHIFSKEIKLNNIRQI